jgi:hypothetical protein
VEKQSDGKDNIMMKFLTFTPKLYGCCEINVLEIYGTGKDYGKMKNLSAF